MAPTKRLDSKDAQHTQFATMARELGCDESEATFDAKLEKAARAAVPRKVTVGNKAAKPPKPPKPLRLSNDPPPKRKIRFNLPGA